LNAPIYLSKIDFRRALSYFAQAAPLFVTAKNHVGKKIRWGKDRPEQLVWNLISGIQTNDDLSEWMTAVEQLSSKQRNYAFANKYGISGCLALPDMFLSRFQGASPRQRETMLVAIDDLSKRAYAIGLTLLWACCKRSLIEIQGDVQKNLEAAKQTWHSAIDLNRNEPYIHLLVSGAYARQCSLHGRPDISREVLPLALDSKFTHYPYISVLVQLCATQAYLESDRQKSIDCAKQAVAIAEDSELMPPIVKARAWGELGLALYRTSNNYRESFLPWDSATTRLFEVKAKDDDWKCVATILGGAISHVLRYTPGMPLYGVENVEIAALPASGSFLLYDQRCIDFFNSGPSDQGIGILQLMAWYSGAMGDTERMYQWSCRLVDETRRSSNKFFLSTASETLIPPMILREEYESTLDTALECGRAMVAVQILRKTGQHAAKNMPIYETTLKNLSDAEQLESESWAGILGIYPIYFYLATIACRDRSTANLHAEKVVMICRQLQRTGSHTVLWEKVASVLEGSFIHNVGHDKLLEIALDFPDEDEFNLKCFADLCSTIDATPHAALRVHLLWMNWLSKIMTPTHALFQMLLAPYVRTYWINSIKSMRFHYNSPQLVEDSLEQVGEGNDLATLKKLFKAIRLGVPHKISSDLSAWLNT
jgi:hypothetical protein